MPINIFGDMSKYYIIEDDNYVFYYLPPNVRLTNKCLHYSKDKNKKMITYNPNNIVMVNHVKELLYKRDINIECGRAIIGFFGKVLMVSFLLAAIFFVLL